MAVSITDNTTIINECETTGDWNQASPASYSGFEREASACMGDQASEGYLDPYDPVSSVDLSSQTLFGWMRSGNPHTEANNGFGFILYDGTDRIAYSVGGSDNWGHFVLGWGGFKMDCAIRDTTAGTHRVIAGTEANLNFAAITGIGYSIGYQTKATGSSDNVFWDILRRIANGTAALTIGGGTTGDRGTFAQIVAADVATTSQGAYGIFRILTTGSKSYEMFYGCDFGDSGTGSSYFEDSDFQLYIAGSDMTAGNMDVNLLANATGTNLFKLDNYVIVGIGTRSNWDLSDANVDTMEIPNGRFVGCGTFALPAGGAGVNTANIVFSDCLQINTGGVAVTLNNGSILESAVAADEGALYWNANADPDGDLDGMTFSKGTNAHHAIRFGTSVPATMTLRNCDFSGFGSSNDANDSVFRFDDTAGNITLNLVGCTHDGSGFTVDDAAGVTVTVVIDPVTLLVNVKDNSAVNLQNARVYLKASDGTGPLPYQDSVTITRSGTTATVAHTAHGMATNDKVVIKGITDKIEDNYGTHQITVTGANAYTYTTTDSGSTSYTGTITSTWVAIDGLTDASGNISISKTYSSNQPIDGWVRKSTSTPRFKSFAIAGTINSTSGLTINVRMILDE